MIVGTRRPRRLAAAGGATRNANTSKFPTDSNDDTMAIATRVSSADVGEARAQPEQAGQCLVECHHEKRAVEDDHTADGDRGRDRLTGDVVLGHARDRSEQEPVEVAGVRRSLGRHHHHCEREEPDEQHADRGVVGKRDCATG